MKRTYSGFKLSENLYVTIFLISLFTLFIHLFTNLFANYGIFRDEFYYIACTKRLAAGYVDQPPLSIYILTISRWIFGESLFALRLLPAFVSAATVYITGLITIRVGGKLFAVIVACISLTFSPVFLGMNTIYSMNTFDIFFWVLSTYILVRITQNNKPVYWILLGLSIGFGMLNKISMIWFGTGVFVGLIFTPLRKNLKTLYPWLAAIIALVIFSPFIIWNITHNFVHLEFISNATKFRYSGLTPIDFVAGQLVLQGPASVLVWLPGIFYLFFSKDTKNYRIMGIIFVTTVLILILNGHSKAEYLTAAYPIAFAAGGLFWEKTVNKKLEWLKYSVVPAVVISGMISIPFALPVLPVDTFINYSRIVLVGPQNSEHQELADLPQFYADMFGWKDLAMTVSSVYSVIPDSEKLNTIVFASNYGEAGAVEYFASIYNLPEVVCPHNSYWYWGYPIDRKIKNVIVIGGKKEDLLKYCIHVEAVAVRTNKYCMPYENNLTIFICKGFKHSLKEIWQSSRLII